jgi:hypothetical protein
LPNRFQKSDIHLLILDIAAASAPPSIHRQQLVHGLSNLVAAQESTEEGAFSLFCSFKSKQISSCQQSPTRLLLTFWNKSPSPSWEFKLPLNRFQIWASMTSQQPQTHGQPLLLTYPLCTLGSKSLKTCMGAL